MFPTRLKGIFPILLVTLTLLHFSNFTHAQIERAEVVTLDVILPINLTYLSAIYDGDDSIYLLGGSISNVPYLQSDVVYRFSIATEEIDIVGYLPEEVQTGDAFWDRDTRSIYYVYGASSFIYRVRLADNGTVQEVETLPELDNNNYLMFTTACWDRSSRKAWIFGHPRYDNPGEDFFELDAESGTVTRLGGVFPNGMSGVKAVFDDETGHAYFIGGRIWEGSITTDKIFRFTPGNNTLEEMPLRLPFPADDGRGIWDDEGNAYVFDTGNYLIYKLS